MARRVASWRRSPEATNATPVVQALLLERYAWAAARLTDHDTTCRALDAVNDAYERRTPDTREPEWIYWLNRNEIDVMAARCHITWARMMLTF